MSDTAEAMKFLFPIPASPATSDDSGSDNGRKIAPLGTAKRAGTASLARIAALAEGNGSKDQETITKTYEEIEALAKKEGVHFAVACEKYVQKKTAEAVEKLKSQPAKTQQAKVKAAPTPQLLMLGSDGKKVLFDRAALLAIDPELAQELAYGRKKSIAGEPDQYSTLSSYSSQAIQIVADVVKSGSFNYQGLDTTMDVTSVLDRLSSSILSSAFLHEGLERLADGLTDKESVWRLVAAANTFGSNSLLKAAVRVYTGPRPGSWDTEQIEEIESDMYIELVQAWDKSCKEDGSGGSWARAAEHLRP